MGGDLDKGDFCGDLDKGDLGVDLDDGRDRVRSVAEHIACGFVDLLIAAKESGLWMEYFDDGISASLK